MKLLCVTRRAGRCMDGFSGLLLYLSALPQAWTHEVILSDIKGCVTTLFKHLHL